jgi:hypothetical protein
MIDPADWSSSRCLQEVGFRLDNLYFYAVITSRFWTPEPFLGLVFQQEVA